MAPGPGSAISVGRKADVPVTRLGKMWEVARPGSGKGNMRRWLLLVGGASPGQQHSVFLSSVCWSLRVGRGLPGAEDLSYLDGILGSGI